MSSYPVNKNTSNIKTKNCFAFSTKYTPNVAVIKEKLHARRGQVTDFAMGASKLKLPGELADWLDANPKLSMKPASADAVNGFKDAAAGLLKQEYGVECVYDNVPVATARWIFCDDEKILQKFRTKASSNLAMVGGNRLTYIAPSMVNLNLAIERWPEIEFKATCEHATN